MHSRGVVFACGHPCLNCRSPKKRASLCHCHRICMASPGTRAMVRKAEEKEGAGSEEELEGCALLQRGLCQEEAETLGGDHLVVLVNGLFGSTLNWRNIVENVLPREDLRGSFQARAEVYISGASIRAATFAGIEVCGQRLAEEIRAKVQAAPRLKRVSLISHSMGGLIARHAAGLLYDPATGRIANLEPCHFVAMASPHLGVAEDGELSLPVLSWAEQLPGVKTLLRPVRKASRTIARAAIGRAGLEFLWADAALGSRPLLHRMAGDHPDTGEFFFSALAAFRTRTAYANSGEDHLVAWSGSSLRTTDELPAHKKQSSSPLAVLTPGKVVEMMTSRVVHPVRSLLGWGAAAAKGGASDGPRGSYVIHEDGVGAGMWSDDPAVIGVLGSEGSMARGSSTEESEASRDRAIRAADSLSPADESTEALRADALRKLRLLPWRRIDVECDVPLVAHNNMQGTWAWLRIYGLTVPVHLVEQLNRMEDVLSQHRPHSELSV